MIRTLLLIAFALVATVAGAAPPPTLGTGDMKDNGNVGFTTPLTDSQTAGLYYIGSAFTTAKADFVLGASFVGTLYSCTSSDPDSDNDGTLADEALCDTEATLNASGTGIDVSAVKRDYLLEVTTPEGSGTPSYLTVRGGFDLALFGTQQINVAVDTDGNGLTDTYLMEGGGSTERFAEAYADLEEGGITILNGLYLAPTSGLVEAVAYPNLDLDCVVRVPSDRYLKGVSPTSHEIRGLKFVAPGSSENAQDVNFSTVCNERVGYEGVVAGVSNLPGDAVAGDWVGVSGMADSTDCTDATAGTEWGYCGYNGSAWVAQLHRTKDITLENLNLTVGITGTFDSSDVGMHTAINRMCIRMHDVLRLKVKNVNVSRCMHSGIYTRHTEDAIFDGNTMSFNAAWFDSNPGVNGFSQNAFYMFASGGQTLRPLVINNLVHDWGGSGYYNRRAALTDGETINPIWINNSATRLHRPLADSLTGGYCFRASSTREGYLNSLTCGERTIGVSFPDSERGGSFEHYQNFDFTARGINIEESEESGLRVFAGNFNMSIAASVRNTQNACAALADQERNNTYDLDVSRCGLDFTQTGTTQSGGLGVDLSGPGGGPVRNITMHLRGRDLYRKGLLLRGALDSFFSFDLAEWTPRNDGQTGGVTFGTADQNGVWMNNGTILSRTTFTGKIDMSHKGFIGDNYCIDGADSGLNCPAGYTRLADFACTDAIEGQWLVVVDAVNNSDLTTGNRAGGHRNLARCESGTWVDFEHPDRLCGYFSYSSTGDELEGVHASAGHVTGNQHNTFTDLTCSGVTARHNTNATPNYGFVFETGDWADTSFIDVNIQTDYDMMGRYTFQSGLFLEGGTPTGSVKSNVRCTRRTHNDNLAAGACDAF